jgi:hypothetical protein
VTMSDFIDLDQAAWELLVLSHDPEYEEAAQRTLRNARVAEFRAHWQTLLRVIEARISRMVPPAVRSTRGF